MQLSPLRDAEAVAKSEDDVVIRQEVAPLRGGAQTCENHQFVILYRPSAIGLDVHRGAYMSGHPQRSA